MRLFLVANGVWFLRVGMMGWIFAAQGPLGMNRSMSGPADIVLVFGCYLIPLAIYEVYSLGQRSEALSHKLVAITAMMGAIAFTAMGVFGTIAFMWLPEL